LNSDLKVVMVVSEMTLPLGGGAAPCLAVGAAEVHAASAKVTAAAAAAAMLRPGCFNLRGIRILILFPGMVQHATTWAAAASEFAGARSSVSVTISIHCNAQLTTA